MLSVSCVDKPPSTGQTADFRQYLCCWQTWWTGTARVEEIERENDRERESRKHRFKLERQNSVTGNLSLSSARQTAKRRGRGQRGSGGRGQGRQDWQVIHDIETDGREETLAWEFYFGWHSPHSQSHSHSRSHSFSTFSPDRYWGLKSQVQGQVQTGIEKKYKENKAPFRTLYIILYTLTESTLSHSASLPLSFDYLADLFFRLLFQLSKFCTNQRQQQQE